MQPFVCPQCGHRSSYDPWAGAAQCPRCGFTPPTGGTGSNYVRWAQRQAHQPYLDELLAHWNGTHQPDPDFTLATDDDAVAFFRQYQQALGEDPRSAPNPYVEYVRDYQPTRQEILVFAGAYLWLRRGDRGRAAADLEALTFSAPQFVDPWVWLTATTDDVQQRFEYLDQATRRDLGHPLARDALALARGQVPLRGGGRRDDVAVAQCPQCGGGLHYEPGAAHVECPHCGHQLDLQATNLADEQARAMHSLRLERRYQGYRWAEARRVVHCRTCGVDLTMSQYLAQCCAFCGSTNVLVEESQHRLEQPDGILPFQVGRDQALAAVERGQDRFSQRLISWLGGGRPELRELQGLYLPFWVFDGLVEAYHFAKGWATTSKETLGLTSHENLVFSAVDVPPPPLLTRIYPFDLAALVPYQPRLLADWPARIYNQDVEMVGETARGAMIDLARQRAALTARPSAPDTQARLGRRITSLDASATRQVLYQVVGTAYQLLLLPVWLARLEREGRIVLGVVNGQNGKAAIEATLLAG